MWEKKVVAVTVPHGGQSDLIGLIDLIEIQLGLSTGEKSLRNRLSEAAASIHSSNGSVSEQDTIILLDAIDRLAKIEEFLIGFGFETARDTSGR